MGGINDIRTKMRELGVDAREVRMTYKTLEDGTQVQVFECDVMNASNKLETVEHTVGPKDWHPQNAIENIASHVADKVKRGDMKPPPKMPNIGPQGLMMAPDTPEQRRIDEAFAGTSRVIPLEAAPEVPSQTPFSLPASDTQTEQDK